MRDGEHPQTISDMQTTWCAHLCYWLHYLQLQPRTAPHRPHYHYHYHYHYHHLPTH
jgi:hypothetical protein